MAEHNQTGKTGEELAVIYLEKAGYKILHTNFRYGRNEVDIIASFGSTLHFVEVKTKAGNSFGTPEQRVDSSKIGRMKKVAEYYLYENLGWKFIQFNILAITMKEGLPEDYFWIEDVF